MAIATVLLAPQWWLPAAGLFAVAALLLARSYRGRHLGGWGWAGFGLRLAALAALAFCLLDPLWSGARARPGANLLAIVADNSQGMEIHDPGSILSRGEQMRDLLDPTIHGWQDKLAETFELRRYVFDSRLENVRSFSGLRFNGRSSAMGSALGNLSTRFRSRPVAGILLLTDGVATDLTEAELSNLKDLPPIYPVIMGGDQPPRDLALQEVRTSLTEFEDAPVTLWADVASHGFPNRPLVARLTDHSGRELLRQSQTPLADHETLHFRFQWKPERPGLEFYQLEIQTADRVGATNAPAEEATLANNRRVIVVDRGPGPHRILYVSGRPNWEYKFLRRAIEEDAQLELVGLIRIARREPKFAFRGRAGETSNPLFRGFAAPAAEELERYDQPVLKRLNTRDTLELAAGFPKSAEELYGYQAIILDDLEADFFTTDQAMLVQRYVAERGGGFLMLGGMESLREGKYARTPIGEVLPAYLDRIEEPSNGNPLHYLPTREGMLQAWTRVRSSEAEERARYEAMPPFQVLNRVREVKPGASVLATVGNPGDVPSPALVVQRFGRGRSAVLTVGDLWRWGQQNPSAHEDMDKSWRQLLRWLVTDVPQNVEVTITPQTGRSAGSLRLEVRVRDSQFRPLENARVTLDVRPVLLKTGETGATNALQVIGAPSVREPGLYEAAFIPRLAAGYQVTAYVTNANGAEVGRAQAGWSSDPAAEEFRSLVPDRSLLEQLAKMTGGRMVAAEKLAEFARDLPQQAAPVMETWAQPIWHTPLLFIVALACLTAEWGIRRWKGLP